MSEEAEAAVAAMNGFIVPGTTKPLVVRLAQKREKRAPTQQAPTSPHAAAARYTMPFVMNDPNFASPTYPYHPVPAGKCVTQGRGRGRRSRQGADQDEGEGADQDEG